MMQLLEPVANDAAELGREGRINSAGRCCRCCALCLGWGHGGLGYAGEPDPQSGGKNRDILALVITECFSARAA